MLRKGIALAQRSLLKRLTLYAMYTGAAGLAIAFGVITALAWGLPDHDHLISYDPPVVSRIYSSDGVLFGEYARERRVFVPIDEVPQRVIQAFVAVEDRAFYSHNGIHIPSIISAFVSNLRTFFNKKGRARGGSTITQQVAKNFLLTKERTYIRKLREAILAWKLEKTLSKKRILELYLNEIYLGAGTYGVASASLLYFDKSLDDLDLHELAFLASLPKAPQNYHQSRHKEDALARRNWVITRMLEEKMISEVEALHALQQPLSAKASRQALTIDANYFAEHVRQHLTERYESEKFYEGGFYVRTSLDTRLQSLADKVLHNGIRAHDKKLGFRGPIARISIDDWENVLPNMPLPKGLYEQTIAVVLAISPEEVTSGLRDKTHSVIAFDDMRWARKYTIDPEKKSPVLGPVLTDPSDILQAGDVIVVSTKESESAYTLEQIPELNGALIAIDPYSGRVLAFDGGYRFTRSQFNRATQAVRQIGSTFKPFVYLAALEAGYTPSSIVLDAPVVLGSWRPQNITGKFYGRMTLRRSLERSVNLAPLRVAASIGIPRIREVSKRLNIYDDLPNDFTTILGSEETTLLRLTAAYAMLANGGKFIEPIFIDRVQDRYGHTVLERTPVTTITPQSDEAWNHQLPPTLIDNRRRVVKELHAYQIISMLEGVVSRGSGRRAFIPNVSIAGKTGTSNDNRDALFIGCTSTIVVGVYVGFDRPQSLGHKHTGGRVAGPIFKAFMEEYLKTHKTGPFPTPANINLVAIDLESGVQKKSDKVILEAFERETNPSDSPSFPGEKTNTVNTEGIY